MPQTLLPSRHACQESAPDLISLSCVCLWDRRPLAACRGPSAPRLVHWCKSIKYKKNSHMHNRKQPHQGKDLGRQFGDGLEQDREPNAQPGRPHRLSPHSLQITLGIR